MHLETLRINSQEGLLDAEAPKSTLESRCDGNLLSEKSRVDGNCNFHIKSTPIYHTNILRCIDGLEIVKSQPQRDVVFPFSKLLSYVPRFTIIACAYS